VIAAALQGRLNGLLGVIVGSRDSPGCDDQPCPGGCEAGAERKGVYVEEIMALMKFSDGKDPVVAKLARAVLILVESLRRPRGGQPRGRARRECVDAPARGCRLSHWRDASA
jgi:hypothetical protein